MSPTVAIVAMLALVTGVMLSLAAMLTHRNQIAFRKLLCIQARQASHIQKRRLERIELRNRKRLMEESVHGGTTAVEALHRTITGTTFDLVDRYSTSEELKHKAKRARDAHDGATRSFYKAVRTTNRAIHALTDMVMEANKSTEKDQKRGRDDDRQDR